MAKIKEKKFKKSKKNLDRFLKKLLQDLLTTFSSISVRNFEAIGLFERERDDRQTHKTSSSAFRFSDAWKKNLAKMCYNLPKIANI